MINLYILFLVAAFMSFVIYQTKTVSEIPVVICKSQLLPDLAYKQSIFNGNNSTVLCVPKITKYKEIWKISRKMILLFNTVIPLSLQFFFNTGAAILANRIAKHNKSKNSRRL